MEYAFKHKDTLIGGFKTRSSAMVKAPKGSTILYSYDCLDAGASLEPLTGCSEGMGQWRLINNQARWRPYEESDIYNARRAIQNLSLTQIYSAAILLISPESSYLLDHSAEDYMHTKETLSLLGLEAVHTAIEKRLQRLRALVIEAERAANRMEESDRSHLQHHIHQVFHGTATWEDRWLTEPPPHSLKRITIETRISEAERSVLHALSLLHLLTSKARETSPGAPQFFQRNGHFRASRPF